MSTLGSSIIALFAGSLLAGMVFFNGLLAKYIQPLEASLVIHLVGLVTSLGVYFIWKYISPPQHRSVPKWTYLAGVFGGVAVSIVGVTVNGQLGMAGTVALMVLGQIIYGWLNDIYGMFGSPTRKLGIVDFLQALLMLIGVGVIIYG